MRKICSLGIIINHDWIQNSQFITPFVLEYSGILSLSLTHLRVFFFAHVNEIIFCIACQYDLCFRRMTIWRGIFFTTGATFWFHPKVGNIESIFPFSPPAFLENTHRAQTMSRVCIDCSECIYYYDDVFIFLFFFYFWEFVWINWEGSNLNILTLSLARAPKDLGGFRLSPFGRFWLPFAQFWYETVGAFCVVLFARKISTSFFLDICCLMFWGVRPDSSFHQQMPSWDFIRGPARPKLSPSQLSGAKIPIGNLYKIFSAILH